MFDIAIIGGGPVGSRTAYRLAEMGYHVVVLEQKQRLDESVCCTGIIGWECAGFSDIDMSVVLHLSP